MLISSIEYSCGKVQKKFGILLRLLMKVVTKLKAKKTLHKYDLFKISDTKTISKMVMRFTGIVNSLKALGRGISNIELLNKILAHFQKASNLR